MDKFVFYCPTCDHTLVSENPPICPKCNRKTHPTGCSKTLWLQLSKRAREEFLDVIAEEITIGEPDVYERSTETLCSNRHQPHKNQPFGELIYSNIGNKIKGLAEWTFYIEVLACIFFALSLLINCSDMRMMFLTLAILVIGPVIAWISSWALYGFGELVDKTSKNEKNTRDILKIILEKKEQQIP